MKKRLWGFGFVVVAMLLGAQAAQADAGKALVNNDYVRVRAKPNKDAPSVGFLYKNMVVEIKAQTPAPEKIGADSYYWYEVKGQELSGWVYGKFLTPSAPNWNVDTYDAPGDVEWLSRRFGESTWYDNQKMNMTSFSLDDYRNLMVAATNGNERAWYALKLTILQHLKENPYDPNYAYLKKRLYSAAFVKAVMGQPFVRQGQEIFETIPYTPELVAATVGEHPDLAYSMPEEYWNDKDVALQVLQSPNGCSSTSKIPAKLAGDADIKAAMDRCAAGNADAANPPRKKHKKKLADPAVQ